MTISIDDYDPYDPAVQSNPYPYYERLREDAPVYYCARRGFWVLSRYEDVRAAFRDHEALSSAKGNAPERGFTPGLIGEDPPYHTRLRRIVQSVFTRRAIERNWGPRIRAICEALVQPVLDGAPFDAVEAFTLPLPTQVIVEMLGIPDGDLTAFKQWSDDMVAGVSQHLDDEVKRRTEVAFASLCEYFGARVHERRHSDGDDLISLICRAVDEHGDALTDREAVYFCVLLLIAGNETTTNLLGNALVALMENPGELAKLHAHPELLPTAVEEMLRYGQPSQCFFRDATRDLTIGGTTIPAGSRVMLSIGAANRDPRVFDDPESFRVDRTPDVEHVAFGSGVHFCLGSMLARLEARTFFETLLRHTSSMALAGEVELVHNAIVRGPIRLPMTVTRKDPTMSTDDKTKYQRGAEVFEQVVGFAPPAKGPAFLRLTVENLFADVWSREGMSVRDRRLITITVLAMMGKRDSLELHMRRALETEDLSPKELSELAIHLAHYAGWPTGQLAFDVAMANLASGEGQKSG